MDNSTNPQQEPVKEPTPAPAGPAEPEIKVRTMHEDLAAGPVAPPPDEPLFTPETVNNLGGSVVEGERSGRRSLMIGIAAGVLVLAGLGYFVLYPRFVPQATPAAKTPANATPSAPAAPSPVVHVSALVRSPAAIADAAIGSLSVGEIRASLRAEAQRVLSEGSFKEINVSVNGNRPDAADYFGALLAPAFDAAALRATLDRDFTALLYYDRNGAWPVYIVKGTLAAGGLESGSLIKNMYLEDPGAFQPWKDGAVGAYATRYAVGSVPGASFNYGAFGDYVIVSTSFYALKAVLPLLGL